MPVTPPWHPLGATSPGLTQLLCYPSSQLYWHSHFHGRPVVNLLLHGASAPNCTVYVNFCVCGGWHGGWGYRAGMERRMSNPWDLTLINCLLMMAGAQEWVSCRLSGTDVEGGPTPITSHCGVSHPVIDTNVSPLTMGPFTLPDPTQAPLC